MKLISCGCVSALIGIFLSVGNALAQTDSYQQTNLTSDVRGAAGMVDITLRNPWGIAFLPGNPFWITSNANGNAHTYDSFGDTVLPGLIVMPFPAGKSIYAKPTGVISNSIADFRLGGGLQGVSGQFFFATRDGLIAGWAYDSRGDILPTAVLLVDRSSSGAVYTGIAITAPDCCAPFLVAANFNSGSVEAFTSSFQPLAPSGSFIDPQLPSGYAPFNIQPIGNQIFISYALQDAAKHDPIFGPGNGIVDVFDLEGNFVKRFVSNGLLNAPWGIVKASASFGRFSNDILIGNMGDGTINAFDPSTGEFSGQLLDKSGAPIVNPGLGGMVFGAGGTGDSNTLYFASNLPGGNHGLFGAISVGSGGISPDFSLAASPSSTTVAAGQSANFTLTATPVGGLTGTVQFSCSAPMGVTCSFNPSSANVTVGPVNTTLTVTTSANVQNYGQIPPMPASGIFLAGSWLLGLYAKRNKKGRDMLQKLSRWSGVIILTAITTVLVACDSSTMKINSSPTPMNRGTASVVVTAQCSAVTHTATLNVTVQ